MATQEALTEDLPITTNKADSDNKLNDLYILIQQMDANMLLLRKLNLVTLNALADLSDYEFYHHFFRYKEALKSHLKLVGIEFYVRLRNELTNNQKREEFLQFENQTTKQIKKIALFLSKCESSAIAHKSIFVKALEKTNASLVSRYEREKKYLLPLLEHDG